MKKDKSFFILSLVFMLIMAFAAVIRVVQFAFFYEYDSGFFTNHNNPTVYIFYGLIILAVVGLVITEKVYADKEALYNRTTTPLTGVGQLILGAAMILSCFSGFGDISAASQTGASGFKAISAELGGAVYFLLPIFSVLAGVVMIIHAAASYTGKRFDRKLSIVNLIPVFWALFHVIERFTVTASYIRKSEIFVEIFTYTFAMIAFLSYARLLTGIDVKDSGLLFRPASYSAAFFSLLAVMHAVAVGIHTGSFDFSGSLIYCALFIFFTALNVTISRKLPAPAAQSEATDNAE